MSLKKPFTERRTIASVPFLFVTLSLASIVWQANLDLNLWQDINTPAVTTMAAEPTAPTPLTSNNPVLSGLFGSSKNQPKKLPTNLPKTRLQLSITGLFANADGSGQALIATGNKPAKLYRVGEQLPGNAVLESVHPEYVVLRRAGRFEQLRLQPDGDLNNTKTPSTVRPPAIEKPHSTDNALSLSERLKRLRAQN